MIAYLFWHRAYPTTTAGMRAFPARRCPGGWVHDPMTTADGRKNKMRAFPARRCPGGCARKVRVLERQARVSHLALSEMLRLFLVCGFPSCRHRHVGANERYPDCGPGTVSVAAARIVREFRMV
jgi:hypothetical protein